MLITAGVIENNTITNIITIDDSLDLTAFKAVRIDNLNPVPSIGWSFVDGEFSAPPPPIELELTQQPPNEVKTKFTKSEFRKLFIDYYTKPKRNIDTCKFKLVLKKTLTHENELPDIIELDIDNYKKYSREELSQIISSSDPEAKSLVIENSEIELYGKPVDLPPELTLPFYMSNVNRNSGVSIPHAGATGIIISPPDPNKAPVDIIKREDIQPGIWYNGSTGFVMTHSIYQHVIMFEESSSVPFSQELIAIDNYAIHPELDDQQKSIIFSIMKEFDAAAYIDVTDPRTVVGIEYLVFVKLLSRETADKILQK